MSVVFSVTIVFQAGSLTAVMVDVMRAESVFGGLCLENFGDRFTETIEVVVNQSLLIEVLLPQDAHKSQELVHLTQIQDRAVVEFDR